jgi:hypothetical protein
MEHSRINGHLILDYSFYVLLSSLAAVILQWSVSLLFDFILHLASIDNQSKQKHKIILI